MQNKQFVYLIIVKYTQKVKLPTLLVHILPCGSCYALLVASGTFGSGFRYLETPVCSLSSTLSPTSDVCDGGAWGGPQTGEQKNSTREGTMHSSQHYLWRKKVKNQSEYSVTLK